MMSEWMGAAGLALYPMIALVIFTAVFIGIGWRLLRRGRDADRAMREAALLPLDDTGEVTGETTGMREGRGGGVQ